MSAVVNNFDANDVILAPALFVPQRLNGTPEEVNLIDRSRVDSDELAVSDCQILSSFTNSHWLITDH